MRQHIRTSKRGRKFVAGRESKREAYLRLIHQTVSDVRFDLTNISLRFDGRRMHNRIVIREHLGYVATWSKPEKEIYIDNDLIRENEMQLVAVHETVEKYVSQKYGFPENKEAHDIATVVEREYARKIGANWRSYQQRVKFVHEKEI